MFAQSARGLWTARHVLPAPTAPRHDGGRALGRRHVRANAWGSHGGAWRMSGLTKGLLGLAKALLILAAFALGAVMWWKINYPTYAWNQKLIVTVSTPRGEVS